MGGASISTDRASMDRGLAVEECRVGGCFHGASATIDAAIIRETIVRRSAGRHV